MFPVLIYFLVGIIKFENSNIYSKNIGIHDMYVKHRIDKNNVIIEGKLILQVRISLKGKIKVYPSGTYTISTNIITNQTVSVTSTSKFHYSTAQQFIEVEFKLEETHLQEEQIRVFRETLDNYGVIINIGVDFKFKIDLGRFIVFPNSNRHIYLMCNILYKGVSFHEIDFENCKIKKD